MDHLNLKQKSHPAFIVCATFSLSSFMLELVGFAALIQRGVGKVKDQGEKKI